MFLAQIFFALFTLFTLSRVVKKFRKKEISFGWFLFWIIFWIAATIVVLLPWTTTFLAERVGIGRGVDLAIYISIIILFYLVFRLFVKLEQMEKNITKIVEKRAIDEFKKEKDRA